jgi:hypothetical protein
MQLNSDVKASYQVVLNDLEAEKNEVQQQVGTLQARLKELHYSILTLQKRIDSTSFPSQFRQPSTLARPRQRYAMMSVRWAILDLLFDSHKAMNTADIAVALKNEGVQTTAANFVNNVSSVLTTTMKGHDEVQQLPDSTWELTENGKKAIEYIRTTPKFRDALRGRI